MAATFQRGEFLERMVCLSAECGCPLTREELETVELSARLNAASFPENTGASGDGKRASPPQSPSPSRGEGEAQGYEPTGEFDTRFLADWVPADVVWVQGEPYIEWIDPGDLRFTDPFFEDTVRRCRCHPFYGWFRLRTPLAALEMLPERLPAAPPAGFIFHLSRCGSTLVAQMLAALERNIVLSEPEPVDGVLRACFQDSSLSEERRQQWLRGMVRALGRRRCPSERHLFIKFDCWHTGYLPLIRRTFPEVPWCFVYRDPVEVLVSHRRMPGCQMAPGLIDCAALGMEREAIAAMSQEEYRTGLLAAICAAAIRQHRCDPGLLLNYRQLPEAVETTLARWFGLDLSAEDRERMRAASRCQAKEPYVRFVDDTEAKQREGRDYVSQAGRESVHPRYAELETLRARPE
jgi:hypothetical protein